MQDIPLSNAVVVAKGIAPKIYPPRWRIVKVLRYRSSLRIPLEYEYTAGADTVWYRLGTEKQQLRVLLEIKSILIESYEVPEQIVHDALMVIPEYRREWQRGTL